MKTACVLLVLFCSLSTAAQNKVLLQKHNEISVTGSIGKAPVTLYLKAGEMIDCDMFELYLEGWYYYDKYKKKIPLSGYINDCEIKLYAYDEQHKPMARKLAAEATPLTIDSLYLLAQPEEQLIFGICAGEAEKEADKQGTLILKSGSTGILLNKALSGLGRDSESFKLPNGKVLNLQEIFPSYTGSHFYSLKQGKDENRLIFYYATVSNHNFCGRCGASDGEKGYRIIYFDKAWNIKDKKEYPVESCMEGWSRTKTLMYSASQAHYVLKDNDDKLYELTVDKKEATIKLSPRP